MQTREKFMTTKEVAQLLNCSHRTLENFRQRGCGPPWYRFGKMVRYKLPEVLDWSEQSIH